MRVLLLGLILGAAVSAAALPNDGSGSVPIPKLDAPVVDLANVIPRDQKILLENELREFAKTGKAQIQVLTVPTLGGDSIEDFSIRTVEQWKLGNDKKDNGVLILVVPQDKKSRIEVGGGLEGELTDIATKRILADQARPFFQRGDFGSGLRVTAAAVMDRLNGLDPGDDVSGGHKGGIPWIPILFILVFFILPFFNRRRMGRRSSAFWGGYGAGSLGSGGWGGGGGGWGSGGGGWSGGGGGFSGGGSSDSW